MSDSREEATSAYVAERFAQLDILLDNAGILPEATTTAPQEAVDLAMFESPSGTFVDTNRAIPW